MTSELSQHPPGPSRNGQVALSKSSKPQRHRWPKLGNRMVEKTERECLRGCRTVKVTMHPHGRDGWEHRVEFWRDGEQCPGSKTPVCEPVEVVAA